MYTKVKPIKQNKDWIEEFESHAKQSRESHLAREKQFEEPCSLI